MYIYKTNTARSYC